jgi:hypothetical protein
LIFMDERDLHLWELELGAWRRRLAERPPGRFRPALDAAIAQVARAIDRFKARRPRGLWRPRRAIADRFRRLRALDESARAPARHRG